MVYLNHFSTILKDMGKEGLSEDITIVPVGGADKIATFISLMRGNELSTVCLLDTFTDQAAQARLKRMVEQKIIADKKLCITIRSWGKLTPILRIYLTRKSTLCCLMEHLENWFKLVSSMRINQ